MGMTPFRFAIAVCCGLAASSVLYVSQKADGSTLAEVAPASIQAASPDAGVAAAPPRPAPVATASSALVATRSMTAKPAPQLQASRSTLVKVVPAASASPALLSPAAPAKQATMHAPAMLGEQAPKRIIIRHSQPGDVVFTMQGEDLQVEFRQAPPPKRQGGRS